MSRRQRPSTKVSVIVRHHNSRWLEECTQSVRRQTHREWEVVLWDDGSDEEFARIALEIAAKDPRIRPMGTQEPQGATVAFKEAVACSHAEILLLLDSDDWLEPQAMERLLKILEDPSVGLATALYDERDEAGQFLRIGSRCHNLLPVDYAHQYLFNPIIFHPLMWRREVYNRVDPARLTDSACCIDRDMILRMTEVTSVARCEEVLYHYRKHSQQISQTQLAEQMKTARQITNLAILRRGLPYETVTSGDTICDGEVTSWAIQHKEDRLGTL